MSPYTNEPKPKSEPGNGLALQRCFKQVLLTTILCENFGPDSSNKFRSGSDKLFRIHPGMQRSVLVKCKPSNFSMPSSQNGIMLKKTEGGNNKKNLKLSIFISKNQNKVNSIRQNLDLFILKLI